MKLYIKKIVLMQYIFLLLLFSCSRTEEVIPEPEKEIRMEYFNLENKEIKYGYPSSSIDLNHDGKYDIRFETLLVGDPIEQVDKVQFLISTSIGVCLPVNINESIPFMNIGDSIPLDDFNGYMWFELSSILLVQKVISFNLPDKWEGTWREANHKFIPFQVKTADKRYNGWVEISADILNEKLILHKAAISTNANKTVCAGK